MNVQRLKDDAREMETAQRKKKILHIDLTRGGGGVEMYIRMLINATNEDYENVLVCAPECNVKLLQGGVTHYTVAVPREIFIKQDLLAAKQVRKIIKKEKPDIVYCHSSMAGAIGRGAALGLGCKVVYNPHGWAFTMAVSEKKKNFYGWIEKILAVFTDKIVAISQSEKIAALQYKVCKENKICLVYNGVDVVGCADEVEERAALDYRKEDFIVACCARLSEQKDPLLFAKVAGIILDRCPNARFIWVGDGELREEFVAALKENGAYEKTWLTGMVEKPSRIIGTADVAVLLSKWEGFGLVLVEYLAQGKPVVATNVGAIPEIITDGVNGTLVTERSAEKIAEAILTYFPRENARKLHDACVKTAQEFSIEKTVETTRILYAKVLAED